MAVQSQDRQAVALERIADAVEKLVAFFVEPPAVTPTPPPAPEPTSSVAAAPAKPKSKYD